MAFRSRLIVGLLAGTALVAQEPSEKARLTALADEVKALVQEGKIDEAYRRNTDLQMALFGIRKAQQPTPAQLLQQLEQETVGATPLKRFLWLPRMAKAAFESGDLQKAENYSEELLRVTPSSIHPHSEGTSIFYGNLILGRVAVRRNDLANAKSRLLASASTKGSPALNSFGPNMSLAKDLLERGEREVVLEYLNRCRTFWKMDHGRLDEWSATVRGGGMPDFRANLLY